jgi:choline dehydrogenase-like flavoprotein
VIGDARELEDGARLEADVCIVGSGAAGLTIARELSGSGLQVCVLESGGLTEEPATRALYQGESTGRDYFPLDACRSRWFGGSTNCWAGLCLPLEAVDLAERDWMPHSGWPFGRALLDPYYRRAHPLLGLGPFAWEADAFARGRARPFPLDGPLESGLFQLSPPLRMGEAWRAEIARARDVSVWLHANVTRLALQPSGRALDALEVRTLGGKGFQVRARRTVLATGGIENARLLLASDDVAPAGVGNDHDWVGRTFMEHPSLDGSGLLVAGPDLPSWAFYLAHRVGEASVWGMLRPRADVLAREQIGNFSMVLVPVAAPAGVADAFPGQLARAAADTDGHPPHDDALWARKLRLFTLGTPFEQAPDPQSRVTLSRERDALGMRRAVLDWRLSELDRRTLRRAQELAAATFGRAGLGRVRSAVPGGAESVPEALHGSCHHMGTTRMSEDPKRGVVDPLGYVHGVADLIVAGSSVFPTAGAANPTLTLVALALRTADHLKEVLAS